MFSCIPILLLCAALVRATLPPLHVQQDSSSTITTFDDVKVPVVLGVMSRCPDALLCESVFDEVLQHVSEKVHISLSFLGKINSSDSTFGVTCMHGPEECAGNVHELCAAQYTPQDTWWAFLQCLNYQGRSKIGEPDITLSCAKTASIDWENSGVGECAGLDGSGRGIEGIELLKESVKVTAGMGITKSCTVVISGKPVCIHDGSWKDCEGGHTVHDFVQTINDEYDRLNSGLLL